MTNSSGRSARGFGMSLARPFTRFKLKLFLPPCALGGIKHCPGHLDMAETGCTIPTTNCCGTRINRVVRCPAAYDRPLLTTSRFHHNTTRRGVSARADNTTRKWNNDYDLCKSMAGHPGENRLLRCCCSLRRALRKHLILSSCNHTSRHPVRLEESFALKFPVCEASHTKHPRRSAGNHGLDNSFPASCTW